MKKVLFPLSALLVLVALSACGAKATDIPADSINPQPDTLIAEGSLQPLNSLAHSFSIAGQVAEVLVENGEVVKAGQELARLNDSSEAKLALENAQMEALAARQTFDQLQSSADLTFAQAQLDLANAQQEYDKLRWYQVPGGQARETNENVINAARAAVTLAQDKVDDAEEKYNKYSEAADSDPLKAAALSTLSNARIDLDQAKFNLNYYLNPPNAQDQAISSAEVAVAKAKYEEALRNLEKLQNGAASNELAMAKARLESANAAVANAQAMMNALVLKANIDGAVVDLVLQPGQKVAAGETVFVIADYSSWLIKTDNLRETEVTGLKIGQPVEVTLDALPEKSFQGEVTYINSLFEEKRGDITYTVTILLTQIDPLMRWGMTGAVEFLP